MKLKRHTRVGAPMILVALVAVTLGVTLTSAQEWPQWAQNPQHTGFLNVVGQNLNQIKADVIYDFVVAQELAANDGDLLVHYQVPLVDGNDVFMESKTGNYNTQHYDSQNWHQNRFQWQGNQLVLVWTFDSDWKAPGSQNDFWEPVYHAVLANGFVYDPGAGGTIFKLNRANGSVVVRLNPFSTIDSNRYTASPLTADSAGNIYYNVVEIAPGGTSFYSKDIVDSWLVKVTPERYNHQGELQHFAGGSNDQGRRSTWAERSL